jgi:hypothetical protein
MTAGALNADQGSTAASFLKLQTGPRAIAMGESFAGLADDVNAIQYNAAGLGFLKDKELTFMHATWFEDIFYDHIAFEWPIKDIGTVALSGVYVNLGSFDGTTTACPTCPIVSTGQFTASDMWVGLSYARAIVPYLSAGLTVKMLSETIASTGSSGVAVDVSALYLTPIKGLSAGVNFQNLGPSLGSQQASSLPFNTRMGVGYKPTPNIAVDMDYTQPVETVGVLSIGGEYGYRDFLFMRLGYKYGGAVDYNQTFTGFGPAVAAGLTMGVGFKLYKNYSADYAYASYGFLGTPQRIALTAKFQ